MRHVKGTAAIQYMQDPFQIDLKIQNRIGNRGWHHSLCSQVYDRIKRMTGKQAFKGRHIPYISRYQFHALWHILCRTTCQIVKDYDMHVCHGMKFFQYMGANKPRPAGY